MVGKLTDSWSGGYLSNIRPALEDLGSFTFSLMSLLCRAWTPFILLKILLKALEKK